MLAGVIIKIIKTIGQPSYHNITPFYLALIIYALPFHTEISGDSGL